MSRQAQGGAGGDHAADRLVRAVERAGAPACVGIDPVLERLPAALRPEGGDAGAAASALAAFSMGVLDAVAGTVPCVKVQAACFERYGHRGVAALEQVLDAARQRGLQVILDAKRGDVSVSAGHYAEAVKAADWVTVNSYLGPDAIEPFLRPGAGVFALVRTTNPGGDVVQGQRLADGRTVAESVAVMVARLGADRLGTSGFSSVGAVVGATRPDEIAALRALMPQQVFLVPGFGAQGGGADDVRACFAAGGRGAVVSASRSVIYAFEAGAADWTAGVAEAARRLAETLAAVAG
jgi:orotidine-5'-phosphate decarboxylase